MAICTCSRFILSYFIVFLVSKFGIPHFNSSFLFPARIIYVFRAVKELRQTRADMGPMLLHNQAK
jgi:hypothetical protein